MEQKTIVISHSDALDKVLSNHGIEYYRPAYSGESVGLDLFYTGSEPLKVYNNKKVLVQTGLFIMLPPNYGGFIKDRGSISKTTLIRRAGVIDPGYTGEVFVNFISSTEEPTTINPGDKLPVQLVVVKCETKYMTVSRSDFDLLTNNAERGDKKVGSSD